MRLLRRIVLGVLLLPVLAIAAGVGYVQLAPVTAGQLSYSIADDVGGTNRLGVDPCSRAAGRTWRCAVFDVRAAATGAGAMYTVRMRGRRCWTAQTSGGATPPAGLRPSATGCVGPLDRLRLFDRI
jgi:hypothetical protein